MTHGDTIRLTAPAKVNLSLNITGRRDDGYHLLDSIVVFTTFGDQIDLSPASGDSVRVSGPFAASLTAAGDNICLRALSAFREAGGEAGPLAIHIDKQIPVGAGLGGGSSDAAAMLRHLNGASAHPLSEERLAAVALSLGADVPVCLAGTAQRMQGIGEILTPLEPPPRGHLVLARPDAMLATGEVFRRWQQAGPAGAASDTGSRPDRIIAAGNDLEAAATTLVPAIGTVLVSLRDCEGIIAAQMSGSGTACFGLFEDAGVAATAAQRLADSGLWAVATGF
ncbi:MAG: 4-(cytidine 5'-diphospho)-2-C-methyl-D-erythritol kinase [Pseudomonadota bacterium]|nr:4-(cytidine 5'-diphospho)-2-C-methyl-D-erythritol kinase [Pseudomonadota bacterium]